MIVVADNLEVVSVTAVEPVIETSGLVKAFGDVRAVDGVDLLVPAGGVYGFLGPNGAGKTTTIRMLATLLRPDSGTARVLGHDVVREADEIRARMSLTGQYASVDEQLTGTENLVLLGRLLGYAKADAAERAEELLEVFELVQAAEKPVKNYSGGMKRRLDIAASVIVTPDLLFLDEPTTGLDPRSRHHVWGVVRSLVEAGTTVLLTTQYLEEADHLADRVAVIDRGRIVAEGTPTELKASVGGGAVHVRLTDAEQRPEAERILARVIGDQVRLAAEPDALSAPSPDPERAGTALVELSRAGVGVSSYRLAEPSLDEVFLALTGHRVDVDEKEEDAA